MADGYARAAAGRGVRRQHRPRWINDAHPDRPAYNDSVPLLVVASTTARGGPRARPGATARPARPGRAGAAAGAEQRDRPRAEGCRPGTAPGLGGAGRRGARVPLTWPSRSTCFCGSRRTGFVSPSGTGPASLLPPAGRRRAGRRAAGSARTPRRSCSAAARSTRDRRRSRSPSGSAPPVALTGNCDGHRPYLAPARRRPRRCRSRPPPRRCSAMRTSPARRGHRAVGGRHESPPGRGSSFGGRVIRVDIDPGQLDAGRALPTVGSDRATRRATLVRRCSTQWARIARRGRRRRASGRARDGIEWTGQARGQLPADRRARRRAHGRPDRRATTPPSSGYTACARAARRALRARGWRRTAGNARPGAADGDRGQDRGAVNAPVIAVAGDGGVLFTIAELGTAVDLGLALPIVVPGTTAATARSGTPSTAPARRGWARRSPPTTSSAWRPGSGARPPHRATPAELGAAVSGALEADRPTVIRVVAPA